MGHAAQVFPALAGMNRRMPDEQRERHFHVHAGQSARGALRRAVNSEQERQIGLQLGGKHSILFRAIRRESSVSVAK